MIYLYILSVILSLAILIVILWSSMKEYNYGGSSVTVRLSDVVMLASSVVISLMPIFNVVASILAAIAVADVPDKKLFSINRRKKSPAQRECECPACKALR